MKKGVLRNFTKFTGKQLRQSLFFNKVADLKSVTLLKTDSGTGVFLRILRNFQEHLFYRTTLKDCCSFIAPFRSKDEGRKSETLYFSCRVQKDWPDCNLSSYKIAFNEKGV